MRLTESSSSRTQWHKHNKFPAQNGTRFHRTNQPETCHTRYDAGRPSFLLDPLGLKALYLASTGQAKLAEDIEDYLINHGACSNSSLQARAELFSGRVLLVGQIWIFLTIGLLEEAKEEAKEVVEAWYGEYTTAALAKKFGKKFVKLAIKNEYEYLKSHQQVETIVVQSGHSGKKNCHADMVIFYYPLTQHFAARITGSVGKCRQTAGEGDFNCDCSADQFTLEVTGTLIREHGVNFEYTNIANVQVTLE